ncbi:hypothetical protein PUN28_003970 [Cardiocondyla obscurior]|uniref:Uncharacterized protein n=1 Tax=Cardiocondyla obscurior TaxID=286306 RepID=A0AAW2GPF0_9HYME
MSILLFFFFCRKIRSFFINCNSFPFECSEDHFQCVVNRADCRIDEKELSTQKEQTPGFFFYTQPPLSLIRVSSFSGIPWRSLLCQPTLMTLSYKRPSDEVIDCENERDVNLNEKEADNNSIVNLISRGGKSTVADRERDESLNDGDDDDDDDDGDDDGGRPRTGGEKNEERRRRGGAAGESRDNANRREMVYMM